MVTRAYRLYEKMRACNFHSDCTVCKILIVAKNSDKCVGGAKWKPFSLPVITALVLVGGLGECCYLRGSLLLSWFLAGQERKQGSIYKISPFQSTSYMPSSCGVCKPLVVRIILFFFFFFFCSRLIQRWVDYIVENVRHTDKEAFSMEKLRHFMDPLACQLLALS